MKAVTEEERKVSKNVKIEISISCLNLAIERLYQLFEEIATSQLPKLENAKEADKNPNYRSLGVLLEELPKDLRNFGNSVITFTDCIQSTLYEHESEEQKEDDEAKGIEKNMPKQYLIESGLSYLKDCVNKLASLSRRIEANEVQENKGKPKIMERPLSLLIDNLPSDLDDITQSLNNLIDSIRNMLLGS